MKTFLSKLKTQLKFFENYILHWGKVTKGFCNTNDIIKASIDYQRRELIKSNHSSTHLLHASLRKIIGNHVTQKGSLVNDFKLRFDFSHNNPIEKNEILEIGKTYK